MRTIFNQPNTNEETKTELMRPGLNKMKKKKPMSWAALAAALEINRSTLYAWRRKSDAPTKPDDLTSWQAFAEELREAARVSPESKALQAEKLKREIALLDAKLAKERRKIIPAAEVQTLLNQIATGQRADLDEWCRTTTPRPMPGADLGEIRDAQRLICDDLCDRMSSALPRYFAPIS